ncbi:MAG: glycosyltransferase [Verrucomicrobia bacterium]|jgi:glycosyltransferase involved in cell wall biosynthesis|nr:glycosyltransferase [Verrucomicrobiota bacterium]
MNKSSYQIRHYTTYPAGGGAGIAADRLVRGLLASGVRADLCGVKPRGSAEHLGAIRYGKSIHERVWRRWRRWQLQHLPEGYTGMSSQGAVFSSDRSAHGMALRSSFQGADLLHFHWMSDMIDYGKSLADLSPATPIVWTLHDMGPFTGGCSYSLECRGFERSCKACPQLPAAAAPEAERSLGRKIKAVRSLRHRIVCIAPSHWLTDEARQSSVFAGVRCETIPNGLDLGIFSPRHRAQGRQELGLNSEDRLILFVAASLANPLKGMGTLLEAATGLAARRNVRIAYLGKTEETAFPENWEGLGNLREEADLAKVYAAADVVVVPSRADNYPNVIAEALASGTPVAGSRIGGIPEMVREGETGWLSEPGDPRHLRHVLEEAVSMPSESYRGLRARARRAAATTFALTRVSNEYRRLYEELLKGV